MSTTVARKTNAGQGWFLADEAAMLAALQALTDWDGDVSRTDGAWQLTLRASGRQTLTAAAGVWLVEDDGLKVIDRATFKGTYDADTFPPEAEPDPVTEVAEVAAEEALSDNLPDELDTKDTAERGVQPNA
jgi:hypothetical protein